MDEIINCWDQKAAKWKKLVGERGDNNRFFTSDPVLWNMLGDVQGQKILDAGCGTGYLSLLMNKNGAKVTGVDISPLMIEEAKKYLERLDTEINFLIDSVEELKLIEDESFDKVVSNYVLMDTPNLEASVHSIYRVLKKGGVAVIVISHPCFNELEENEMYFRGIKKRDRWGEFDSDFIYFHRPLNQYLKTFRNRGFQILEIEEPIPNPNIEGFKPEWLKNYKKRPWSIVFKLEK